MTTPLTAFRHNGHFSAAYETPLLAAMMRPVHPGAGMAWAVSGRVMSQDGLRHWLDPQTIAAAGPAEEPYVGPSERIAFAILCARSVYGEEPFATWADNWLSGRDRTTETALRTLRPVTPCDRAYAAHWAVMAAAFPQDATLPAQTAAIVAAYVVPGKGFDFAARAQAALDMI